jgi:hypothetical protein
MIKPKSTSAVRYCPRGVHPGQISLSNQPAKQITTKLTGTLKHAKPTTDRQVNQLGNKQTTHSKRTT